MNAIDSCSGNGVPLEPVGLADRLANMGGTHFAEGMNRLAGTSNICLFKKPVPEDGIKFKMWWEEKVG